MADNQMDPSDMKENAARACGLLKSMANETRLMILCQLAGGERSVGELLETVPLSQSALSQHLAVLRREDLVETRRVAQSIKYSLSSDEARAMIGTLYTLYCAPNEGSDDAGGDSASCARSTEPA